MKSPSLYSTGWMHRKVYEPIQRNKDGLHWIMHRFEIKDGISFLECSRRDMCKPNPLMKIIQVVEHK